MRLCDGYSRLMVAEGIGPALSLLCGLMDGPATVWAALSTSGLRGLRLPPQLGRLTIARDGDRPDREAAHALAKRAHAVGWQVSLLPTHPWTRLERYSDRERGTRMTAPQPIQYTPEGPQPLVRETPTGAEHPVHTLGPLRADVEAVQGMTQAPVAIPAASALSVASLALQGFADDLEAILNAADVARGQA